MQLDNISNTKRGGLGGGRTEIMALRCGILERGYCTGMVVLIQSY